MDPDADSGSAQPVDVSRSEADTARARTPPPTPDERTPHRIVVDVLATRDQVNRLHEVLGQVLCDAPLEHDGPCRIAWLINSVGEPDDPNDPDDDSYGFDAESVANTREFLSPIEVWHKADVDKSLGL